MLNNLVSEYFDFVEIQAMRKNPMYMKNYIQHLDAILTSPGENFLVGSGKVSHNQALEKAKSEYKKYQIQTFSTVEKEYLEVIKNTEKTATKHASTTDKAVKK